MKELIFLFGFMTLPAWIPVIGLACGTLYDMIRGDQELENSPLERVQQRRAQEAAATANTEIDEPHAPTPVAYPEAA